MSNKRTMTATSAFLKRRVSVLKNEVSKLRQELGHRQKELNVLESALRRLPDQASLSQQGQPAPNRGPWTGGPIVVRRTLTIASATRDILRDCGKPMRCPDILTALKGAGRKISYATLNSILSKQVRRGRLSRPEPGFYAYGDGVIQQPKKRPSRQPTLKLLGR